MATLLLVLKILGGVLAGLLLLAVGAMFLPVKLILLHNGDTPFSVGFRVLGTTFGGGDKPKGLLARAFGKVLGDGEKKPRAPEKKKNKPPLVTADKAPEVARLALDLLCRLAGVLPRCRVEKLVLRSVSSGADAAEAAMSYGLTCAAVYPLVGFIESHFRVSPRGKQVELTCDYDAGKSSLTMEIRLSLRIGYLVGALLGSLIRNGAALLNKEAEKHEA